MAGFGRGKGDAADILRNLVGALGSLLNITGDFVSGGALLFHSSRDHSGNFIDLRDGDGDPLDGLHGLGGSGLHAGHLLGDLAGRLSGLVGKGLYLIGDHSEALAGVTRSGRLDGGVQRQ